MRNFGTLFSFGIVTLAVSSSVGLSTSFARAAQSRSAQSQSAQSRSKAPKPLAAVSQSSQASQTSKHSLFKRKARTSVAPIVSPTQEEQSQPSEQAQSRAWLQDAASRVQAPDAATLREEMRQSERLRQQPRGQQPRGQQLRDRFTPQSQQSPQRSRPNVAISQAGQI